jgi:hypothetical protein
MTRPSCSRVIAQHPRGTTIRNTRQLSIVSREELVEIAKAMGIDEIHPSSVGASIMIEGIPDFTHITPSTRLQQYDKGTTLCVDMCNDPCIYSGRVVAADGGDDSKADIFKSAAAGLRGVTAWVEREGKLSIGDVLKVYVPHQRPWQYCAFQNTNGKASGLISVKICILFASACVIGYIWRVVV